MNTDDDDIAQKLVDFNEYSVKLNEITTQLNRFAELMRGHAANISYLQKATKETIVKISVFNGNLWMNFEFGNNGHSGLEIIDLIAKNEIQRLQLDQRRIEDLTKKLKETLV